MSSDLGALPSRLGRYEILGLIGSGSFADVARAWDEGLASHVAIKVLNAAGSADDLIRSRFIEEGQLLRRVHSDNVLAVHDIGELDDGRPYLVVDLAEGGNLDERLDAIEGGPVDPGTVKMIVDAIADGLTAVHEAGIVHRDIKPENLLIETSKVGTSGSAELDTVIGGAVLEPRERLLIGDLGLAKDLTSRGSTPSVIGGSARYQAPEQMRADGVLGPPTDLYAATAVLWRLLAGHVAPEPHDVADELTIFRPGWQAFFARAMAMDPLDRYPTADAWRAAVLDQLDAEPSALAAGDRVVATGRSCPYKGLAAFQPEDADVFFGREDLVDELIRRLQLNRVLVVAGPSGSGKSSVIRAGLLPSLRNGGLPGSERWRYELFTPGTRPIEELHYRLTRELDRPPRVSVEELTADPQLARRLLDDAQRSESSPGATEGRGWLLYIDQFEEVFTQPDDPEVADAFIEALSAMADPTDSRLRLVMAVRADFYNRCAQVSWLAQRITENQVLVGPMSGENMRRAIEEPARRNGLRFEAGLVDAVLDEGGRSAGSLPLISHALVETWARRDGNVLTFDGFRAAGGVAGAIAQSADALFDAKFDERQQRAARRLLLRLVTPGEGTADTRRLLPFAELDRDPEPELVESVVDEFVAARLLAVDERNVEIAHEALIVGWPRLRDWIDGERENLRFRHRIGRAAAEWDTGDRDPDLLWRGTPLATAVEWTRDHGDTLDRLEQEFIDSAVTARREAEEAAARRAARAQRTRRLATAALAGLTLASVIASIVALVAFTRASDSADVAERQFANALGTTALGQAASDPRQALLLAMESRERSDMATVDARAAMIQARLAMATSGLVPSGPPVSAPGSFQVALRPDGKIAAVADTAGPIRLYDTETGSQLGDDLTGHTKGARSLDFDSTGTVLVSSGADGLALRWDLTDPAAVPEPGVIVDNDFTTWYVDIHPNDRWVAVSSDDKTVRLYDLDSGEELQMVRWDDNSGGVITLAFSPDGRRLLASNRSGRINGWDTETWDRLWDPESTPTGPNIWEIEFTPDGTRFVTAGDGPGALLHDAETGLAIPGIVYSDPLDATGTAQIRALAFSPDGERLLGGSTNGTVHTWDVDDPDGGRTTATARHTDAVEQGDISRDGSVYVSVGDDKQLRVWQAGATPLSQDFGGFADGAYSAAFDPSGPRLAVGDGRGQIHLLALDGTADPVVVSAHDDAVWDLVWHPDGAWLASVGADGQVLLWEPTLSQPPRRIGQHQTEGRALAVSPDGRLLASADIGDTAGEGADVLVWNTESGTLVEILSGHDQGVRATAFSPDGEFLATADGLGEIRIWSTGDLTLHRQWRAHPDPIWALAYNRDGRLASVSASEEVRVFDPATGEQVGSTVAGLRTGATGVGFDADGQTVAVVTQAGMLHLVDWDKGVNLTTAPIPAHRRDGDKSFELAFDPDGVRFVTAGTGGTIRVWDVLSTERACAEAAPRPDPSIEADLFDGTSLASCS